jgi:hypothetical protein
MSENISYVGLAAQWQSRLPRKGSNRILIIVLMRINESSCPLVNVEVHVPYLLQLSEPTQKITHSVFVYVGDISAFKQIWTHILVNFPTRKIILIETNALCFFHHSRFSASLCI